MCQTFIVDSNVCGMVISQRHIEKCHFSFKPLLWYSLIMDTKWYGMLLSCFPTSNCLQLLNNQCSMPLLRKLGFVACFCVKFCISSSLCILHILVLSPMLYKLCSTLSVLTMLLLEPLLIHILMFIPNHNHCQQIQVMQH